MSIHWEIERKFLVAGSALPKANGVQHILQGYLTCEGPASVRVRMCDGVARLTIKDRASPPGQARAEFEYDVPLDHAHYLLTQVCPRPPLEKRRHNVTFAGFEWIIDEFMGENKGLILAEIELGKRNDAFPVPFWVGMEVTSDPRYHNSYLYQHPYCEWRWPGSHIQPVEAVACR
ncbi:MAG: CYTH domain-containing protein [Alphaproteobacteria bacterium]|nr:CYTH domain-containing protein [Alphaproteobacteria bacterium]